MFSQKTLNIADPQSTCLLTLTVTPPVFREKPPPSDRTVTRLTLMIVRPHTRQVAEPEQREKILYNNTLLLFLSHSISAAVRKEKSKTCSSGQHSSLLFSAEDKGEIKQLKLNAVLLQAQFE